MLLMVVLGRVCNEVFDICRCFAKSENLSGYGLSWSAGVFFVPCMIMGASTCVLVTILNLCSS